MSTLWARKWKLLLLGLSFFSGFISIIVLYPTKLIPSVYEIWWKGFNKGNKESESKIVNNNKFGNAQGIIEKLPYIKSLGVDYVWITPFFQSPQLDNGYDISDYYHVDPLFGTDQDFRNLLRVAHNIGLKVIIDSVMNHTSNEHEWFQKALKGDEKYMKYYWFWTKEIKNIKEFDQNIKGKKSSKDYPPFFHDNGLNDNVGNKKCKECITPSYENDLSLQNFLNSNRRFFSQESYLKGKNTFPYSLVNSDKEFDPKTNPYYLHTFSNFQPDLNWNNPEVRKEMAKITNFYVKGQGWLKGEKVDGFRFDAIPLIGKAGRISDGYQFKHSLLVPDENKLSSFLSRFKDTTYGPKNLFTIGELSQAKADDKRAKANNIAIARKNFTTSFLPLDTLWNFDTQPDGSLYSKRINYPIGLKSSKVFFDEFLQDNFNQSQTNQSGLIMENHDQPRSVTRFAGLMDGTDQTVFSEIGAIYPKKALNFWKYFSFSSDDHVNKEVHLIFARAKSLALFKFFQQGIPIIYQGQEIGTDNYPFYPKTIKKTIENPIFYDSLDLQSKRVIERHLLDIRSNTGSSKSPYKTTYHITAAVTGRDSARNPFQWSNSTNAGWADDICFLDETKENDYFTCKVVNGRIATFYLTRNSNNEPIYMNMRIDISKNEIDLGEVLDENINYVDQTYLTATPLILNPHYKQINVQEQEQRLDSPLNFYRKLLYLRKTNSVLNHGSFKALTEGKDFKVLNHNEYDQSMTAAYTRSNFWGTKKYLVITNLDYQARLININLGNYLTYDRLLLNTHSGLTYQNGLLELAPYQGIVVEM